MADRWVEVGDGVLARRHKELDLTTGLVVGGERALVVDTAGDSAQGSRLYAAVREVTRLPLVVAVTHAHFDHCFGTGSFPPCAVHAHPRCRASIVETAAAQREEWTLYYRDRGDDATADALAATDPPLPEPTVEPQLQVDLGGRTVTLLHPGRGHTDHDVVAVAGDVVFAGDLVEQGAPPDFADAAVADWPATVTRLLGLGASTFVAGHGDPMSREDVEAQRDGLAEVAALYEAVGRGDLDPAGAQARSPFPNVPWPA
ncbi:MAG: MBL fold metallo-hydrolase [Pseudonocardia sp.]|uniref:MBL fold metallo-hydrolase n=1 Tax=unclassified Pseudonocardia TaxID=2619320 RepID=UPI00086BD439|nr:MULTISPECIES: MBL fold metallo-hydrolase [unclassified Pseudonocardia]MBN9110176.1 MBL fold metallo-hydrolase [Pseudonocardia sp.]ODU19940.1 MAG: MBL fold metallo-hydrolase [Pseudonocardia sp. SCN 72-51]ODV07284.1 MAG: MBL fold metallo-hydrolase [Pseudonocardia sp. SCN 73-27]